MQGISFTNIIRNKYFEYIEEMDASNTCALLNQPMFKNSDGNIDYATFVRSDNTLIEFNITMMSTYGMSVKSTETTTEFTTYFTDPANFPNGTPVLRSGQTSIVTGYLGYPTGSSFSNDFYIDSTMTSTGFFPFRDMSPVVTSLVSSGDICSADSIYNQTVYNGSNIGDLSLTTLYKTLVSDLPPPIITEIQTQIDILQNKNKMFYSFFVCEYCYYNSMYNFALNQFFYEYTIGLSNIPGRAWYVEHLQDSRGQHVRQAPAGSTTAYLQETQSERLDAIAILLARINSRLIDMRNVLSAIQDYYSTSLVQFQNALNTEGSLGSDKDAESKVISLKNQFVGVESAKNESMFRQGIVEYTSEKNRYSNILLGIYAFLNIAIIAVIFNIKE